LNDVDSHKPEEREIALPLTTIYHHEVGFTLEQKLIFAERLAASNSFALRSIFGASSHIYASA